MGPFTIYEQPKLVSVRMGFGLFTVFIFRWLVYRESAKGDPKLFKLLVYPLLAVTTTMMALKFHVRHQGRINLSQGSVAFFSARGPSHPLDF